MGTIVVATRCGLCGKRYSYEYRNIEDLKPLEDEYCPKCRTSMENVTDERKHL